MVCSEKSVLICKYVKPKTHATMDHVQSCHETIWKGRIDHAGLAAPRAAHGGQTKTRPVDRLWVLCLRYQLRDGAVAHRHRQASRADLHR
eukprot:6190387-Pleurochrysis_carterae.AAC.2